MQMEVTHSRRSACSRPQAGTGSRAPMERRASRTAYYLNRRLGYLALIATAVRFPAAVGVWVPVADPERTPLEVLELLELAFPGEVNPRFPSISLLTDHDVEEFERELQSAGRLAPDDS